MPRTILLPVLGLIAVLSWALPAAAARVVQTDHPLVAAYAGSSIYSKDVKEFDAYRVFKGWDKSAKAYKTESLEGKVTKILYKNPPKRSLLEIYRNYENAFKSSGVTVLYACDQANKECMDAYVGANLRREFGLAAIGNKSGRYLFARLDRDDQTAYLMLAVGDANTDVHVVEMKKMQTGMAALNLAALSDGLSRQGFVVVEGIYFDSDKTELEPESDAAIAEVAKLLQQRAELSLYVVGHTDMQGSLDHNMALSEGRARAVVARLVQGHGIAAARLEGRGIGPLAPVASNLQDGGRAKNRRVVLVQR